MKNMKENNSKFVGKENKENLNPKQYRRNDMEKLGKQGEFVDKNQKADFMNMKYRKMDKFTGDIDDVLFEEKAINWKGLENKPQKEFMKKGKTQGKIFDGITEKFKLDKVLTGETKDKLSWKGEWAKVEKQAKGEKQSKGGNRTSAFRSRNENMVLTQARKITKGSIRRLARRGGVKRMSSSIYEEVRSKMVSFMDANLKDAVTYCLHGKRRTVKPIDIVQALRRQGRNLYGYGC